MHLLPPLRRIAVATVFAARVLHAQSTTDHPRSMADVVAFALAHNPDVITSTVQIDSARGEQGIARAFPNPTFSVVPGNPFQYTVNQTVDVGPNRLYRTRVASAGVAAAHLDRENMVRQVVFATREGFLDLMLADAVRDVAFTQDTIVRHLLQNDSLRFREGDLALRDLSTTELQSAHADASLARADAALRSARIALQVLMGVPHPDTSFRVTGTLDYRPIELGTDSLGAAARAARPDIAAAQVRIDQSRAARSLSNSLLLPVPGIAGVYQREPFASGSNYALGLSLSIPVFYWFGGERRKANAGLRSANVAYERSVVQAESDVIAAVDNLHASQILAARYAAGLIDKAQAALDMQRFAYEHGNASLLDLLNAINAFGDTQTDYYTALHDFWVAAYAIDRAVGRDIVP